MFFNYNNLIDLEIFEAQYEELQKVLKEMEAC
jgi:hypothetical protein